MNKLYRVQMNSQGAPDFSTAEEVEAVPERKKGRWIRKTDGKLVWWECSECGEFPLKSVFNRQDVLSEYCPHCGTPMTEGAEDDPEEN